jgi:hypothetical protein
VDDATEAEGTTELADEIVWFESTILRDMDEVDRLLEGATRAEGPVEPEV